MNKRCATWIVAALLATTIGGCSGSKYSMQLQDLRYPASMSGYLYDADDTILSEKEMEVVGELDESVTLWAMVWSKVDLNGESSDHELAGRMNAAVEESGGEGVIDLTFSSDTCGMDFAPVMSMLPFWPGCTRVRATGTIVRRVAAGAPSDTPAPPAEEGSSQVSARR